MAPLRAYPVQWTVLMAASLAYGYWSTLQAPLGSAPLAAGVMGTALTAMFIPAGFTAFLEFVRRGTGQAPFTARQLVALYAACWVLSVALNVQARIG